MRARNKANVYVTPLTEIVLVLTDYSYNRAQFEYNCLAYLENNTAFYLMIF